MTALVELSRGDWAAVYRLMRVQKFPAVPATFAEAQPYFERVTLLGVWRDCALDVVFAVGVPQDGIAFLDAVCAPDRHGAWARPGFLLRLKHMLFGHMRLRAVWVQVEGRKALRASLQAGFMPVTALDAPQPILVMTRRMAGFDFDKQQEILDDGFAFQGADTCAAAACTTGYGS